MTIVIGFGHQSDVGKDTACNAIVKASADHSDWPCVEHRKFSAAIKSISHELFRYYGLREGEFYERPGNRALRKVKLPEIGKSPEELWIEVGTKGREIYENVWCDMGMEGVSATCAELVVFSDVRSMNEAVAIKAAGGKLVKILRAGSEVLALDTLIPWSWPGWDEIMINGAGPGDLGAMAVSYARRVLHETGVVQ